MLLNWDLKSNNTYFCEGVTREGWTAYTIIYIQSMKKWRVGREWIFVLSCLLYRSSCSRQLTLFAYNCTASVDLLLIMPISTTLLLRANDSLLWIRYCAMMNALQNYNWNDIPKEFSYTTSSDGYRGDNNAPLPWLRPASSVIVVSSSTSISFPFSPSDCGWRCCCSWRWYGNPVLTINGMLYLPIGCTPNTFLIPTASYPSMGQVAKPWDVQDNIYVIATSMVFFWDHVWEVWRVGNNCMWRWASRLENNRVGMDLVLLLLLLPSEESKRCCCMEYNHLIIAPSIDTPNRTKKENGTDRNDGRGYPLEKSRMSSRTLSNSLADSERRLRDDVDDIDVDLVGVIVVSVNVIFLFEPASSSSFFFFSSSATESPFTFSLICLFKKSIYRRPSHPTPTSAKNIAVQSESRTRSAFRPRQYCATVSLSFCECTSIIR